LTTGHQNPAKKFIRVYEQNGQIGHLVNILWETSKNVHVKKTDGKDQLNQWHSNCCLDPIPELPHL
jgi:hypothetical protein